MHFDSAIALFIAIGIILLLIKLRKHVGYAILAGASFLAIATLPSREALSLASSTLASGATLKLMLILFSVLLLSYTMESAGMLSRLTSAISSMGGKAVLVTVPLIIGLLPMPAGALVSAMMLAGMVKEQGIPREKATFANYWFRHLWIPTWPLYPAFIITMGVVETSAMELIRINLPLTLAALFAGLLITYPDLEFRSKGGFRGAFPALALNAWPIIAIILLALVAGVELAYAMLAVLFLTLAYTRPSPDKLIEIGRKALDPRMGVLIYGVMLFRNGIEASSAASRVIEMLSGAGLPITVVALVVSFLIGFAVGIEMGPPSIALPLFISFVGRGDAIVGDHLLLIFAAGYLGVQLSPMHLCFTVSAEYFKASMTKVYRYVG
ncbi:DUF401 family protein, partial [Candidatus Pyrohabitans sp.]